MNMVVQRNHLLFFLNLYIVLVVHSIAWGKLILQRYFVQVFRQIYLLNFLWDLGCLIKPVSLSVEFWNALIEPLLEHFLFFRLLFNKGILLILNVYFFLFMFLFCHLLLKVLSFVQVRGHIVGAIIISIGLKVVCLGLVEIGKDSHSLFEIHIPKLWFHHNWVMLLKFSLQHCFHVLLNLVVDPIYINSEFLDFLLFHFSLPFVQFVQLFIDGLEFYFLLFLDLVEYLFGAIPLGFI